MKPTRIDFPTDDPARFNALRDQWTDAVSRTKLPKIACKIAPLLLKKVNRNSGYAFPTDEEFATTFNCSLRLVGQGMAALQKAGLIERQTRVKRDEKGEAVGRIRHIYLSLPDSIGERNTSKPKVNGTHVNGTLDVNGTNGSSERNSEFRIIPNHNHPDKKIRSEAEVHVYVPAREGLPPIYGNDLPFLEAFDRAIIDLTDNKDIAAGELEHLLEQSFYSATKSDADNPPIYWSDICALRQPETQTWFRRRAGQLIYRKKAA